MKKRSFIMILSLVLVLGLAVGGTVAYLTAQSETVTNTFTVGNIKIALNEHEDGTATSEVVTSRNDFKVVPGGTDAKDPFVTVKKTSEPCYVYVSVENTLVIDNSVVCTPNINTDNWIPVATKTAENGATTVLYRYKDKVDAASADQILPVFTTVTYSEGILADKIEQLNNKTITLKAYAHQSENLGENAIATADDAIKTLAGF